jgi:hypothetical protein
MVLAAIMATQAFTGLLFPEAYRDVGIIRMTWFGNDLVTLFIAVPLLIAGMVGAARGSCSGVLLWLGAITYAVYNYAFYAFGAALNAFFVLYLAVEVLASVGLILALSRLDIDAVAHMFQPSTPVRFIGGSLVLIGSGLAITWISMWAAYVFAGRPTPVDPEAFKVVAALDLALMVPALNAGGVLLWKRRPWGYIIASLASIQGAVYLLVLSVNALVAIRRGLANAPGELPIWGLLLLFTTVIALVLLSNVRRDTCDRVRLLLSNSNE